MIDSEHLFWDSCVFIRWLTGVPDEHLGDLDDYIDDAKNRCRTIYYSTLIYTEIRPRYLTKKYGTIRKFIDHLTGTFYPIDPNPNILIAAGELKDARAVNPGDPKDKNPREIGTPDAVHLMTATFARDALKIPNLVFHTFDNGKGITWEGRCIPLLTFERWFPAGKRTKRVEEVCSLPREKPLYPQTNLLRIQPNAQQPDANPGE